MQASQNIPQADRVALHATKKDAFDLTSARVFLDDTQYQHRVGDLVKEYYPDRRAPNGAIKVYTVVHTILLALTNLHTLWRKKAYVSDVEVEEAERWAKKLGESWKLMGWKATVWVHWTVAIVGGLCGITAQCTFSHLCRLRGGSRPIKCTSKTVFRVVGEESACLREGHAPFAQHVCIGRWAKTCWEPISRDGERTKEEQE